MPISVGSKVLVQREDFDELLTALAADGRTVLGPRVEDGAVVYAPLSGAADLPAGVTDEQEGGRYRLRHDGGAALFGCTLGAQGWKRHLFPPHQRMWAAERGGSGFRVLPEPAPPPRVAFLGVRACELAAIAVQDKVFAAGAYVDPVYAARRKAALIVAVQCGRACATCFCDSMGTGPQVGAGHDLLLSEIAAEGRHVFVVEVGSQSGAAVLDAVPHSPASAADLAAAAALPAQAAAQQKRRMDPEAQTLLKQGIESPRWEDTAKRCLTCGNCTQVCPTCFCSTTEDTTELGGDKAERWKRWDSCFTIEYSYIHGGSVRREASSRYRQWITHKLATWHDQFGVSGCVGCGRCITWCPVGIDVTEEVAALRAARKGG